MGGTESTNFTAEGGIKKLRGKKELIKDYFRKSKIRENYMQIRCSSIEIPGYEINQDSSFFLFNFEGFFDIEKGFYSTLYDLLEISAFLFKNKYDISSYEELEACLDKFCIFTDIFNSINYKEYILENKQKNIKEVFNCLCKKPHNIVRGFRGLFDLSMNLFGTDIEKYCKHNKIFSNVINILGKIIPYKDFKALIDQSLKFIENTIQMIEGGYDIYSGTKIFCADKINGALTILTGIINIGKAAISVHNDIKRMINYKEDLKLNKAQENFTLFLNHLNEMVKNLENTEYKDLYENNIIILALDQKKKTSNESAKIEFMYIDDIDYYAEPLNKNDTDRLNYIKNMLIFYNRLFPYIEINEKNLSDSVLENGLFLMLLRNFITKHFNNKDEWINFTKKEIEIIIGTFREGFDKGDIKFENQVEAGDKIFKKIAEKINKKSIETKTSCISQKNLDNNDIYDKPLVSMRKKQNNNNNRNDMNNSYHENKNYLKNSRIKNNKVNNINTINNNNSSYITARYKRMKDNRSRRGNSNHKGNASPAPVSLAS